VKVCNRPPEVRENLGDEEQAIVHVRICKVLRNIISLLQTTRQVIAEMTVESHP
jgi:hypothetical protein